VLVLYLHATKRQEDPLFVTIMSLLLLLVWPAAALLIARLDSALYSDVMDPPPKFPCRNDNSVFWLHGFEHPRSVRFCTFPLCCFWQKLVSYQLGCGGVLLANHGFFGNDAFEPDVAEGVGMRECVARLDRVAARYPSPGLHNGLPLLAMSLAGEFWLERCGLLGGRPTGGVGWSSASDARCVATLLLFLGLLFLRAYVSLVQWPLLDRRMQAECAALTGPGGPFPLLTLEYSSLRLCYTESWLNWYGGGGCSVARLRHGFAVCSTPSPSFAVCSTPSLPLLLSAVHGGCVRVRGDCELFVFDTGGRHCTVRCTKSECCPLLLVLRTPFSPSPSPPFTLLPPPSAPQALPQLRAPEVADGQAGQAGHAGGPAGSRQPV
jgi:hypothetical protein